MATTDILLIVFIAVAAVALLGQFFLLLGLSRRLGELAAKVTPLLGPLEQSARALPPLVRDVQQMVTETRPRLQTLAASAAEISLIAREQVKRADALATDFSQRLELQVVRMDEAMATAMAAVEQITTGVRDSVLRPVQDVQALVQGLRTGLDFFFRRRPSPVLQPRPTYHDEEMFI
ncbi:MAG TPA: hypothetical protein VMV31_15140 [Terriglobales bacterium]|nr:hypothetical protein [Terriglobales bacterium]